MLFGRNQRKLNQEAFYLDKDHIEITHEYKYLLDQINFFLFHWVWTIFLKSIESPQRIFWEVDLSKVIF